MAPMVRIVPVLLLLLAAGPARPAELAVDLKNDGQMAVSVPLGTDNAVTSESDFEVTAADDLAVRIYPRELYRDRFWSQPLAPETYEKIAPGAKVRPVRLDAVSHAEVRAKGEARLREYREKQEQARRHALRMDLETLREKRARLEGRLEDLEERIDAAEKELFEEEGRFEWVLRSEDGDIDRSVEEILDLSDRRDELQTRRLALSREAPLPKGEIHRLTEEIRRLNNRIESKRRGIVLSRDRIRSARYAFRSRMQQWRDLLAQREGIAAEIGSVERKIRDVADSLR